MNGIIRWYNENRKKVWVTIGIIICVILLLRVLNSISHEQLSQKNNEIINKTSSATNKELMNSISMSNDKSVISGEKITTSQKKMLSILDDFNNYCSTGDTEKAYNLLSDECKEEMYPTKEAFEEAYYKQIFNGDKKKVSANNWIGNTYKVKYTNDSSTGTNDGYAMQDYITLVTDEEGNVKLNINGYIGREKINKSTQGNNLLFKVVETDLYMDYQKYTYEITNHSNRTVYLNDPDAESAMYIEDGNNKQYKAYMHEISPAEMRVVPGETKKLTVKYYNKYNSNKEIKHIVFGRVILDYEDYTSDSSIVGYSNYYSAQINL